MENKKTNTEQRKRGRPKKVEAVVKKPRGRPSLYSDELAELICQRISEGETLREICRSEGMPSFGAVYEWREKNQGFSERLARARDQGEEVIALECLAIADDGQNDWMLNQYGDGADAFKLNGEHVQRSKLRIETRLKLLKIWNPKKYGEKLELSGNKDAPMVVQVVKLSDIPASTE